PDPSRLIFDITLLSETPTFTTSNGRGTTMHRDADIFSPAGAPSHYDVVLVPGGSGSRAEMRNLPLLEWLQEFAASGATGDGRRKMLMSVCTGSLILAAAGLLDGVRAATHHAARALLAEAVEGAYGRAEVVAERVVWGAVKGVDVVTCGGVSSGIDAALEVVRVLAGEACARGTAEWIEYEWKAPEMVG
ncbi:class I glutamine amidotransferase-like protein, partial [Morchella conica CCBAS932]